MDKFNSDFKVNEIKTEPASTEETTDPCNPDNTPVDASELCNTLATIEGAGTYDQRGPATSTASGRYQIINKTGYGELVKLGHSKRDAKEIWDRCKRSSSPECKKIQDQVCNSYSSYLQRSLKNRGIPITRETLYLAWNQGGAGAGIIWKSIQTGQPVTNPKILKNMRNQRAWAFSSDGATFFKNMQGYMRKKGVNPGPMKT